MTHHLHPNPDVDDMLRAANARAEAAEAERDTLDALRKEALNQRDAAERRLAAVEALDLVGELAELRSFVWAETRHEPTRRHVAELREALIAALSDTTALDALIARERAAALAPLKALADAWEREAEPYLPGGKRYAKASDSLVMRADCRDLDAARLRYAIRDIERKAEQ